MRVVIQTVTILMAGFWQENWGHRYMTLLREEPEQIGMETVWNKVHYNTRLSGMSDWDFSKYIPQVVIVAVGQNDCHPEDYMKEEYCHPQARKWWEHLDT